MLLPRLGNAYMEVPHIASRSTLSSSIVSHFLPHRVTSSLWWLNKDVSQHHKELRLFLDLSHATESFSPLKDLLTANKLIVSQFPIEILSMGRWYFQLNENCYGKCLLLWKESFSVRNVGTIFLQELQNSAVLVMLVWAFCHVVFLDTGILVNFSQNFQLQSVTEFTALPCVTLMFLSVTSAS